MNLKLTLTFLLFSVLIAEGFTQISQNISLIDQQIRPGSTRYSGSWFYVDSLGNEYALLGANKGLVAYDLMGQVEEVGFIPGPTSNWREITVVKDHAYVVTEGTGPGQGMQVVDLRYLPDSLHLVTTYSENLTRVHIIQSDIFNPDSPYVYLNGITPGGGMLIMDVSDPANPEERGYYGSSYIHDCHVHGEWLYAAAIYAGKLDIVDISNKDLPVLITQIVYPSPFTHSSFSSADHNYLYVTDEIDGLPMRIWDIRDLNNITEVAQFTANPASLVHNPYVVGDFAYLSHNTEGLRILDVIKPDVPVEVGFYDTYVGPSGGFSGLWSACPFLPSGKIIGGDRVKGLYVWEFNGTKAGRVYGIVVDSVTQAPLFQAGISFVENNHATQSNLMGSFKFGTVPGTYTIECTAEGYLPKTMSDVSIISEDSIWVKFELVQETATSAINPLEKDKITFSPNPFTDIVRLDWLSAQNTSGEIFLYGSGGKLLFQQSLRSGNENILDISGLPSGTIFYIIQDHFGYPLSNGKLVKL